MVLCVGGLLGGLVLQEEIRDLVEPDSLFYQVLGKVPKMGRDEETAGKGGAI